MICQQSFNIVGNIDLVMKESNLSLSNHSKDYINFADIL